MIKNNYKYGISLLPEETIPYKEGYKFGAYRQNLLDKNNMHIVEFFKTKEEIQNFVNNNKEYGKEI